MAQGLRLVVPLQVRDAAVTLFVCVGLSVKAPAEFAPCRISAHAELSS
jgi:hypothetical protein